MATPFLLLLSLKSKYRISIPKRFFLYKNPPFKKAAIWFHVCSFGEARSLKPLLADINDSINISVTTQTGYESASMYDAEVRYLPFEVWLPFWVKRQKVLVVSEAELWYMLFFMAKKRGAKTILINARISDNSYQNYRRFSWFYRRIFAYIDMVFAQSEQDKVRLLEIGAKNVTVTGNIKAYGDVKITKTLPRPSKKIVTLASTHAQEETLMLAGLEEVYHDKKIIVVPRHPERFHEVAQMLQIYAKERGLSFGLYSEDPLLKNDLIMIDMLGELINIYAISDTVLLGGSFVENVGGHNPLEPATFGCKILSGKYIFNQKSLYEMVENIEMTQIDDIAQSMRKAKPTKIKGKVDIKPILEAINVG